MPDLCDDTVAPHRERRIGSMSIGPELLLPVLVLPLLYLNDDVGNRRTVSIEDDDVRTLGTITPEGDGVLDRDARPGVAKLIDQACEPELTGPLLRLELNFLVTHQAGYVGHLRAPTLPVNDSTIECLHLLFREQRELAEVFGSFGHDIHLS